MVKSTMTETVPYCSTSATNLHSSSADRRWLASGSSSKKYEERAEKKLRQVATDDEMRLLQCTRRAATRQCAPTKHAAERYDASSSDMSTASTASGYVRRAATSISVRQLINDAI